MSKIDRRGFLAAVAALPLAGAVKVTPDTHGIKYWLDLPLSFRGVPIMHVENLAPTTTNPVYGIVWDMQTTMLCNSRRQSFVFTPLKIPTIKRRWLEYEDLPRRCRLPELLEEREGWV